MERNGRGSTLTVAIVAVAAGLGAIGCGDDDLPAGNGVVWECVGLLFQNHPLTGRPEPIAAVGPDGEPFRECANGNVSRDEVRGKCQEACTDAYSGSFPWNFLNTLQGIDTPDCVISDAVPTGAPCGGSIASVTFMNGGPAQSAATTSGTMSVDVSGETGNTSGVGSFSYTVGPCQGDTCDFRVARFAQASGGPFTIGGRTVSAADVQNFGETLGTFTPSTSTFVIPPGGLQGQVNFVLEGRQGSLVLPNPQPVVGTLGPASVTFSGTLAADDRSIDFSVNGAVTQSPPTVTLSPAGIQLECSGDRRATVSLAAQVVDPDGDVQRVLWSVDQTQQPALGPTFTATLGLGTHVVSAVAVDTRGGTGDDTVFIGVADRQPPRFTVVPPPVTVSDCRSTPNIGRPTVVDDCGSPVTVTNNAPATFPVGNTMVTWTARDQLGNVATAIQLVTVELGDDPACCPAGTNVVVLTSNNDTFTGTPGNDCILGRGGQDVLNGGGGNDFISGGAGDDVLSGGTGNDRVFGGTGQDRVNGGDGNDHLSGGDGDDLMNGDAGDDVMSGGQGQDRMSGSLGNDLLVGDTGDDTLDGGAGNDTLDGSGLHDLCIGGPGTNVFLICERRE